MIYPTGYRVVHLACDECDGEPENVGFETFAEAKLWDREHNWQSRKAEDGEWENICPQCSREIGLLPQDQEPILEEDDRIRRTPAEAVWKEPGHV